MNDWKIKQNNAVNAARNQCIGQLTWLSLKYCWGHPFDRRHQTTATIAVVTCYSAYKTNRFRRCCCRRHLDLTTGCWRKADCSWPHWCDGTIPRPCLSSVLASRRTSVPMWIWTSTNIRAQSCTVLRAWIRNRLGIWSSHPRPCLWCDSSSKSEWDRRRPGTRTTVLYVYPDAPFFPPLSCVQLGIPPSDDFLRTNRVKNYCYLYRKTLKKSKWTNMQTGSQCHAHFYVALTKYRASHFTTFC